MKNIYILLFLPILFLGGCKKNFHPKWELGITAPLVVTSLSIQDIVPSSILSVNSDNSLKIVFKKGLKIFKSDTLVKMPDIIEFIYKPQFPGTVFQPGQVIFNAFEEKDLDLKGAKISLINIKNGNINVEYSHLLSEDVYITYKIPSLTKNGSAFEVTEFVPRSGSITKSYDLSGYLFDLTGSNRTNSNKLDIMVKAILSSTGNPITISAYDNFSVNTEFENISFYYAKGYFGSKTFTWGSPSEHLGLFSGLSIGGIDIEKISLFLEIENGFGVDAQLLLTKLASVDTNSLGSTDITGSCIGKAVNISRAIETNNPYKPVMSTKTLFEINSGNISQFIESLPDVLIYGVEFKINPLGNVSCGNDFIYFDNYVYLNFVVELALSIKVENLVLAKMINFNVKIDNFKQRFAGGQLNLIINNGFPFATDLQLFLLNENDQIIDSLLVNNVIKKGIVDENNHVITQSESVIQLPIDQHKLDVLSLTKKILLKAKFNTYSNDFSKIYSDYKIDVKLSAIADYNMKL